MEIMLTKEIEKKTEWENSYENRDNYVFYPHEEVIRSVSRHLRKRIDLNEFIDVKAFDRVPRLLDLGCGIGRHIVFGYEMEMEAYGIDLSEKAIQKAVLWATSNGIDDAASRVVQGDVRNLPWSDGFFDFVVSHGVLDSMYFEIARDAVIETHRVLGEGGLFYCDLIASDENGVDREEIVQTAHEQGTVQSYFNRKKIDKMFNGYFEIVEGCLIHKVDMLSENQGSRYHLTLQKIA